MRAFLQLIEIRFDGYLSLFFPVAFLFLDMATSLHSEENVNVREFFPSLAFVHRRSRQRIFYKQSGTIKILKRLCAFAKSTIRWCWFRT